jgi:hypothetical protein
MQGETKPCEYCGGETDVIGVMVEDDLMILKCKVCKKIILPHTRKTETIYEDRSKADVRKKA